MLLVRQGVLSSAWQEGCFWLLVINYLALHSGKLLCCVEWQGSSGGSFGSGLSIANRGQIRFYRKGPAACVVKLTISYEVPDILAPLAGTLTPIVENILRTDLGRFAKLAAQEAAQAAAK